MKTVLFTQHPIDRREILALQPHSQDCKLHMTKYRMVSTLSAAVQFPLFIRGFGRTAEPRSLALNKIAATPIWVNLGFRVFPQITIPKIFHNLQWHDRVCNCFMVAFCDLRVPHIFVCIYGLTCEYHHPLWWNFQYHDPQQLRNFSPHSLSISNKFLQIYQTILNRKMLAIELLVECVRLRNRVLGHWATLCSFVRYSASWVVKCRMIKDILVL